MAERVLEHAHAVAVEHVVDRGDLGGAQLDGLGEGGVCVEHIDHHRHGSAPDLLR